ncbi:MAG: sulfite exporter TauE/SafE family protein [FCB group bacterium]|nr:sulfite exporter TauE/SafE family protein [FCB group bacterium]
MAFDFSAIFLIGFLSSFSHCYGMCGGFVLAYSVKSESSPDSPIWRKITPHLLYNGGRILTYTLLGAWFGLLGGSVEYMLKDYQALVFIFAGIVMVVVGIDFSGLFPVSALNNIPGLRRYIAFVSSIVRTINYRNIFLYGFVLGFIPCGLVYVAGAKAAATGDPLMGMVTMAIFGLGTFPALLLLGLSSHLIGDRFRRRVFRITAVLVIVFGVWTIWKGAMKLTGNMEHKPVHRNVQNRL